MTATKQIGTRSGSLRAQLSAALADLGAWWLAELRVLLPSRAAQWLLDPGSRNILLQSTGDTIACCLRDERGTVIARVAVPGAIGVPAAIESMLRARRLKAKDVAIGIDVAPELIFRRQLLLPLEAAKAVATIAAQDLLRKTPFRLADIHHDHTTRRADKKLVVDQLVVQRTFVEDAAHAFGMAPADIAFLEVAPSQGSVDEPSRLWLRPVKPSAPWLRSTILAMTATAILLPTLAVTLEFQRQQSVFDQLASQLTVARAKAQQVRAALDKTQQERTTLGLLRSRKWEAASVLDIWEELSRVLPSHSWLTEVRLSENPEKKDRKIMLTGFSSAAADLVELIDKSPLFQDVALAAPIAVDPTEQRERFVLQATISNPPATDAPR